MEEPRALLRRRGKMMRRVLVDAARAARRQARRGEAPIPIDGLDVAAPDSSVDVIALERAR
jgi:hypothetical protein